MNCCWQNFRNHIESHQADKLTEEESEIYDAWEGLSEKEQKNKANTIYKSVICEEDSDLFQKKESENQKRRKEWENRRPK